MFVYKAPQLQLRRQHDGHNHGNAGEVVDKLTIDARRFARHGAHLLTDKPLLDAFKARRSEAEFWLAKGREPATDEVEERSNVIVVDAEAVLFGTPATTIEGVVAKLRALYPHISDDAYAERALVDPAHLDFRDGLKMGGGNEQVLWACIDDLARIGGVQMAEQER